MSDKLIVSRSIPNHMNSNPSRRDVVKMAGAASAAVGPFIQKVKAANDQVQYGFIGTGQPRGRATHA